MGFSKKDFERNKKAFRRTWEIDPSTRVTPSIKIKKQRSRVDWQSELDADNDFDEVDSEGGDE